MCLQGRAGQLRSFFILFTQNERCMLSPPRARPSHWAQNPLTRTEQGSTGQPLIRMTKLYCFHTNTWSNQNTHLTGHTAAHIHKKKKNEEGSISFSYLIISAFVWITYTWIHRGASFVFLEVHFNTRIEKKVLVSIVLYFPWPQNNLLL